MMKSLIRESMFSKLTRIITETHFNSVAKNQVKLMISSNMLQETSGTFIILRILRMTENKISLNRNKIMTNSFNN